MSASTLRDRIIAEFALVNHTQTARKFYPAIGQDWKSPADPNAYHPQRAIAECLGNAIIPEIVDTEILNVKQRFDPTPNLPVSPTIGDTFLATATARGWTVDKLYTWNGTTYDEQTPTPGLPVWILATNTLSIYSGITSHWLDIGAASAILTALSGLTYSSGSPLIRMTGASAFSLDTATYLSQVAADAAYQPLNPSTLTNISTHWRFREEPITLNLLLEYSPTGADPWTEKNRWF